MAIMSQKGVLGGPHHRISVVDIKESLAGEPLDVPHSGPDGGVVSYVTHHAFVSSSDVYSQPPMIGVALQPSADSTSSNTARLRIEVLQPGRDLNGITIRVFLHFFGQAGGGIG